MRGLLGIISNSMLDSDTRKFRRIYVFLGALKSGFKARKRELLGLNGCFMSGPYPGQVLIAVGVNPNNGTYPLAYAMVESETKDSWRWFLDSLGDDLELFRNSNFTFVTGRWHLFYRGYSAANWISFRHKGFLETRSGNHNQWKCREVTSMVGDVTVIVGVEPLAHVPIRSNGEISEVYVSNDSVKISYVEREGGVASKGIVGQAHIPMSS
ncbi:mutator type transposase [Tanacetum coccineum]